MMSYRVKIINDQAVTIHKLVVHRFSVGDAEDPDLYAAQPLLDWQKSEQGKWIMEHAVDQPEYHRHLDHNTYGYQYAITAELTGKDYTFYTLKWGSHR